MLNRLQQALAQLNSDEAVDRRSLIRARTLLSECPAYEQAVEQLSSQDIEVSKYYLEYPSVVIKPA
jgi:hypothetical protein